MAKTTKAKTKNRITKETTFAEILGQYPEAVQELMGIGLACGGCPMSMMESVEGGAFMHGMNPDKLVEELNSRLNDNE